MNQALQIHSLVKSFKRKQGKNIVTFNALDSISLNIEKGARIGIVGVNGAGKSTLLKVISRILLPTSGSVEIFGTVNSLLEVGTGFDPELSGRDNIYLNASILGLVRTDINHIFNEILDFSGVSKFIDLPVKYLSSGMYARLAFAVATHIPGEILLIDEVLSVGDALFRKRALQKMESLITDQQRTILFVSHSTDAIAKFCNKVIWLDNGKIREFGDTMNVLDSYFNFTREDNATNVLPILSTELTNKLHGYSLTAAYVADKDAKSRNTFSTSEDIFLNLKVEVVEVSLPAIKGFHLYCAPRGGVPTETHVCAQIPEDLIPMINGVYSFTATIPKYFLASGTYRITPFVVSIGKPLIRHQYFEKAISFNVIDDDTSALIDGDRHFGVINPRFKWASGSD
ncbi:MAG: ABC transporter ATP-binding protein [Beijerinckiaceae bacterium]|nr:ABC transporter ATP-binding protein [Beijerinckiaceae bacterium]